jgi:uncharacterized protein
MFYACRVVATRAPALWNLSMAPTKQTTKGPSVDVSADKMQAQLRIPAELEGGPLDFQAVEDCVRGANIPIDDALSAKLKRTVDGYRTCPAEVEIGIAEGKPATPGKDGELHWEPGLDPTVKVVAPDSNERINYYEQCAFISVSQDQHIATVIAPTDGEPGADVFANPINATPGKAYQIKLDTTVRQDSDGKIFAVRPGLLSYANSTLKINPVLDISESVDFSTGNIRFVGSVAVGGGVCDRFKIEATEDVIVKGLIEAAHITCQGNLQAEGGMTGREQGTIIVGRDLIARYMIGVSGRVAGHATLQRELLSCTLLINGALEIPEGALIGGDITVGGIANLGALGSPAAAPTILRMGFDPTTVEQIRQLSIDIAQIDHWISQPSTLRDNPQTAGQTVASLRDRRAGIAKKLADLRLNSNNDSKIQLTVAKFIHPGVMILTPNAHVVFQDRLKGPLTFSRKPTGHVYAHISGTELPLDRVARILNTD